MSIQFKKDGALKASQIDTPLGRILAIADNVALHLLKFIDNEKFEHALKRLKYQSKALIENGDSPPIISIAKELDAYFAGNLITFNTPLASFGTPFQKHVWQALRKIPYGETKSYAELAKTIGKPKAYRALGSANGANPFVIITPCHRVINANGNLGGFSSGLPRKKWLLHHEQKYYKECHA